MGRHQPILASERTAAALLDMTTAEFRRLVERGALPPARRIGDLARWDVDHIRRIISGESINDEFEP